MWPLLGPGPGGGGEARASDRRAFLCARGPVGGFFEDAAPLPFPLALLLVGRGTWYELRGEREWDLSARGAVVKIASYDLSSSVLWTVRPARNINGNGRTRGTARLAGILRIKVYYSEKAVRGPHTPQSALEAVDEPPQAADLFLQLPRLALF